MLSRRPSLADLARQLKLHPSTVSRALAWEPEVSADTRQRVLQLADEWRFQPNRLAVALRKQPGGTPAPGVLGVLVPHLQGEFYPVVVAGITAAADAAGYRVLLCQSGGDARQQAQHLALLARAPVAGLLVAPVGPAAEVAALARCSPASLPLVLLGSAAGLPDDPAGAIATDDYAGAYAATAHLLAEGCRRVAHLGGLPTAPHYQQQHRGYAQALRDHGQPYRPELIVQAELTAATGAAGMARLLALPTPPDSVFAASDLALAGALPVLRQHGRRVPQDIALVGFGNATFTELAEPPLSTVDLQPGQLGQAAVQQLLELPLPGEPLTDRRVPILLKPELLVRASSRRAGDGPARAKSV